jgi:hypothetical protein
MAANLFQTCPFSAASQHETGVTFRIATLSHHFYFDN